MILVDTSVWIDYFNGVATAQTERLDVLLGEQVLLTGDLILVELMRGFRSEREAARALALLAPLEYADMAGREIALRAAEHFRALRRRGVTVRKTMDLLIGTFCLAAGHELLHADRDFGAMERYLGLRVVRCG